MKLYVMSLLLLLFWVSGMDDAPKSIAVCGYCSQPLLANVEPLIRMGCDKKHLFHKRCLQHYMPDYTKRNRYAHPSESTTSLEVSALARQAMVCPHRECTCAHVDKHQMVEIDGETEIQLFPEYKGIQGRLRQAKDVVKELFEEESE